MSSILDALRKFEATEAPRSAEVPLLTAPPPAARARTRGPLIGVAAAFAAGVALTLWFRIEGRSPATSAPAVALPPQAAAVAPPQPAAAVVPAAVTPVAPPPVPREAAPARLEAEPAPAALAPAVPVAAPAAPPPSAAPAAALPPAAPPAPAVVNVAPPVARVAPAPPPVEAAVRAPEPAAAPSGIKLSFLVYSKVPERRTVALSVDGSLITLHEGEESHGVEVTRILSDRVELRQGGRPFVVQARN